MARVRVTITNPTGEVQEEMETDLPLHDYLIMRGVQVAYETVSSCGRKTIQAGRRSRFIRQWATNGSLSQ